MLWIRYITTSFVLRARSRRSSATRLPPRHIDSEEVGAAEGEVGKEATSEVGVAEGEIAQAAPEEGNSENSVPEGVYPDEKNSDGDEFESFEEDNASPPSSPVDGVRARRGPGRPKIYALASEVGQEKSTIWSTIL